MHVCVEWNVNARAPANALSVWSNVRDDKISLHVARLLHDALHYNEPITPNPQLHALNEPNRDEGPANPSGHISLPLTRRM